MVGGIGDCVGPDPTFLRGKRKVRGQNILLLYNMTENDQASTQILTVEAYYEGKRQGGNGWWNDPDPDYFGNWLRRIYDELKPRFANQAWTEAKYNTLSRNEKEDFEFWMDLRRHFEPPVAKTKNGRPKGTWELTLTYSPKWFQDDTEAQEAFKKAEHRLLKYYADELELYRSVGEFTKDGRAHLHIIYRLGSGGKFTDKNLTRAYPKWNAKKIIGKGNQGGQHAICQSASDYAGYIEKHLDNAWHHYEHKHANDNSRTQASPGVLGDQHGQDRTQADGGAEEASWCEIPCSSD